jgi:hypothetical protein
MAQWLGGWTTAEQLDGSLKALRLDNAMAQWAIVKLDGSTGQRLDDAMARRAIIELKGLVAR